MQKIPTIFTRLNDGNIINEVSPGCRWVFNNEGRATEKLAGLDVRLTLRAHEIVRVEKRRDPGAQEKQRFAVRGFRHVEPWYVDASREQPADQHIFTAVDGTDVQGFGQGEFFTVAVGPSIQGNPLEMTDSLCFFFSIKLIREMIDYGDVPRDFDELDEWFAVADSLFSPGHKPEGLVFHHPDGRLAKIKATDFAVKGAQRPTQSMTQTIDQRKGERRPPLTQG